MPSASKAQDRFVRAAAARGESWAKKWVADEHGTTLRNLPERKGRKTRRRERISPFTMARGR